MERLKETQLQHYEHRELREQTLAERHNLKGMRKKLRDHRTETRDTEARFITELRQVCLNAKKLDFEHLFGLYQDVEDAHDELGAREEDYDEEEQRYGVLELRLTKNEGDIIGDLLEDIEDIKIVPPRLDKVTLPKARATPTPQSTNEIIAESKPAGEIQEALQKYRLEQPEILGNRELLEMRRSSAPTEYRPQHLAPPDAMVQARRPRSESDLASLQPRWPSIRVHVSQWILETLEVSPLQKAIAKAQLQDEHMDNGTWWEMLKKFWSSDAANNGPESGNEGAAGDSGAPGSGGNGHAPADRV
ncbi:hypothetical protein SLS56_003354 [Neofusicoccum ribis]|uniref:Uncharacterized protein n=1 Tax=Neofusicoccum ribis TaxID=45134 RepID=A0ABR3SZW6_9PEZI